MKMAQKNIKLSGKKFTKKSKLAKQRWYDEKFQDAEEMFIF